MLRTRRVGGVARRVGPGGHAPDRVGSRRCETEEGYLEEGYLLVQQAKRALEAGRVDRARDLLQEPVASGWSWPLDPAESMNVKAATEGLMTGGIARGRNGRHPGMVLHRAEA
jgi:hypothetical protein